VVINKFSTQQECTFGKLINKNVLKIQSKNGQNRIAATCCCYSPDGNKHIAGAADGSIHIWNVKKQYFRPDIVIRPSCYVVDVKARGVQEIADSIKGFNVNSVV
jgi:WD40 repeat protein